MADELKFLNGIDIDLNKVINLANGTADNDAVNKGQLDQAIGGLAAGLEYKGTIVLTALSTLATFPADAKKGDFYIINEVVSGPVTVDGRAYNNGDHVVFNVDVVGAATTASMDLIKNSEFPGAVYVDAVQTLTNKTIDAASNTITNITNTEIAAAAAIAESKLALDYSTSGLNTAIGNVANDVANLVTLTGMAVDSTHLGEFTGTTIPDNVTIKPALQALETAHEAFKSAKYVEVITGNGSVKVYTVTHNLNNADLMVEVVEVSTNEVVYPKVTYTSNNVVTITTGNAAGVGKQYKVKVRVI